MRIRSLHNRCICTFVLTICLSLLAKFAFAQQDEAQLEPVIRRMLVVGRDDFSKTVISFQMTDAQTIPRGFFTRSVESWRPAEIPRNLSSELQKLAIAKVKEIDEACDLSDDQARKLRLAAELYQRNVLRRITTMVASFDGVSAADAEVRAEVSNQLHELRMLANPSRNDPLFDCLLEQMLSGEQKARMAAHHLHWYATSAARSAVLGDVGRQQLLELLHAAAQRTELNNWIDRRKYVNLVFSNVDQEQLKATLGNPSAMAVIRFANYFQNAR